MASVITRTLIIYVLLSFTLRIMGKRQLGELDVAELVSTLLISEIASIPIDDPDIPLLNAIIPILFIFSIEIIISTLKNKSERLKGIVESTPTYIIYKGRLLQSALRDNRVSINELLSEARVQGVGDISEIYYAIMEQNGSMSLIMRGEGGFAHPIIIDGTINYPALKTVGYSEGDVESTLNREKLRVSDVFLMTVNDNGKTTIIEREKNEGQNNCGGTACNGNPGNKSEHMGAKAQNRSDHRGNRMH